MQRTRQNNTLRLLHIVPYIFSCPLSQLLSACAHSYEVIALVEPIAIPNLSMRCIAGDGFR